MKTRIFGTVVLTSIILLIAFPGYSQDEAWSVAISSQDPAFLEVVLKINREVADASFSVTLYDANGNKTESQFPFKDKDGSVLGPGVYKRLIRHNVASIRTAQGKYMFCMPPLLPGVRPTVPPTPLTSENIWDQSRGIVLK